MAMTKLQFQLPLKGGRIWGGEFKSLPKFLADMKIHLKIILERGECLHQPKHK